MQVSIEISFYPLEQEYVDRILEFIEKLRQYDEIYIQTNEMSTVVKGDMKRIFEILGNVMEEAFYETDRGVFLLKVMNALE